MDRTFRFSAPVCSWLVVLAATACAVALVRPLVSLFLGGLGLLLAAIVWAKVSIRVRKWLWWEFADVSLSPIEGFLGTSGAVLFAAMFVAGIGAARNAV